MNRFLLFVTAATLCGGAIANAETAAPTKSVAGTEQLQFPNTDVLDVLEFYGHRLGKRVFVAAGVEGAITLRQNGLTREQTLEAIRNALIEQLGLAFRVTPDEELLVEWSKDPKYPADRMPPITDAERAMIPKAGDRTAGLKLRSVQVRELLKCYGKAVNKPVFVLNSATALVTLEHFGPRDEFPDLIRKTLLQKYGIAMRESKGGEILVEWSNDPKYPRQSDPPPANVKPVPPRPPMDSKPRTRVRPISKPPSSRP